MSVITNSTLAPLPPAVQEPRTSVGNSGVDPEVGFFRGLLASSVHYLMNDIGRERMSLCILPSTGSDPLQMKARGYLVAAIKRSRQE